MTLCLSGISVAIGGRTLVRDVALEAGRGELLVLVGPNGAGKTTLLKAVAGLLPHDGTVTWDGASLDRASHKTRARHLAYLPQGHVAHWPLTVRDVVAIGRAPTRSSLHRLSETDRQIVDRALAEVRAEDLADRRITTLSGGERARVMLARALAVEAPILLADEPIASLDPSHQLGVMSILKGLARNDRLVVAVIHDVVLATRFADRVLVLDRGRARALGPPAEALDEACLRDVFGVESRLMREGDRAVRLPWAPVAREA